MFSLFNKKSTLATKDQVSTVALVHQLRSALTAIKWPLKMVVDGDYGAITDEQKNMIERVIQKNEGLISLVNNVLATENVKKTNYGYHVVKSSLEEIIVFLVDFYKEELERKHIVMDLVMPKEKLPLITIDKEMITLAIQNLFDNAIKYTPLGGRIKVFLSVEKKNILFKIQDTGIGVPAQNKEKLFDRFFRASNAIKMDAVGSGLGLFISKEIIEAHRGKIWFESEENIGSIFYVALPL